jgi:hypothetical protein
MILIITESAVFIIFLKSSETILLDILLTFFVSERIDRF